MLFFIHFLTGIKASVEKVCESETPVNTKSGAVGRLIQEVRLDIRGMDSDVDTFMRPAKFK